MPDDQDYSAEPPRRKRPPQSFDASRDEDYDDGPSTRREVPKLVRTAGIIWIIFGGLILVNAVVNLGLAGAAAAGNGASAAGGSCGGILGILFGIAFVFVGVQSVKGTATDTLGNGIGSIIIGVLNAGLGVVALLAIIALSSGVVPGPNGQPIPMSVGSIAYIGCAVSIIGGLGLILAGSLALMARAEYKAYRRAGKRRERDRDDD